MVRRRRTVAVVVLAVVLVGLLALALRLTGESGAVEGGTGPVPAGSTVVVVAPGETLGGLSSRVAPAADPAAVSAWIRDANHLSSSGLVPGRPLVVPAAP
ncbi:LysM peptidoglycan-binding domain-containing protein [Actinomycetospora atypica]|uniref:LysM peptidoglycan-binding domain-containing protein n=1 Tax=Actinomycetospora atypica TaxID=1290095 RepID=A0ABV9YKQ1_9PSEU